MEVPLISGTAVGGSSMIRVGEAWWGGMVRYGVTWYTIYCTVWHPVLVDGEQLAMSFPIPCFAERAPEGEGG